MRVLLLMVRKLLLLRLGLLVVLPVGLLAILVSNISFFTANPLWLFGLIVVAGLGCWLSIRELLFAQQPGLVRIMLPDDAGDSPVSEMVWAVPVKGRGLRMRIGYRLDNAPLNREYLYGDVVYPARIGPQLILSARRAGRKHGGGRQHHDE